MIDPITTPNLKGARFVLTHTIDRFPHFILREGTHGAVTHDESDEGSGMLVFEPDDPVPGAEEWDNEVHYYGGDYGNDHSARLNFLRDARPLLTGDVAY